MEKIKPPTFDLYEGNEYNEKRLHNLNLDPEEKVNLFDKNPDLVQRMMNRLRLHCKRAFPPIRAMDKHCKETENKSKKHQNVCIQSAWLGALYRNYTLAS